MASEDNDKGQESVRRTLWPAFQGIAQSSEKNSRQKKFAGDIQHQQQTNDSSPIGDERDDVFSASIKQTFDEIKPAKAYQNQDYISSGRTDEERRQAFLADLYEGPYVNIGRPILVPVSRLGRTKLRGTSARMVDSSPVDLPFPSGFRRESPGAFLGHAASDNTSASSAPIHLRSLSVGEAPRSNKTIRLEKNENTSMNNEPIASASDASNSLIFDPNSNILLALGMNSKTIDSAHSGSGMDMDMDTIKTETDPSTPPPPPSSFQQENGSYGATPDRPRSAKTTPATMSPYDGTEAEESPTLRFQMRRLRVTSAGASNSSSAAGSDPFGRPSSHPHSPHPYYFGYAVPRTPTKGKRARGEFEKTTTLSGRDVAREREILARFAAAAKYDDDEEEEKEEGEVEEDDEEELTPKASVLNRHMDIDDEE